MSTTLSARPLCQQTAESATGAEATRQAPSAWVRAATYGRCGCGKPWAPGDLIARGAHGHYCGPGCVPS
jgi:hypothetical protein